MISYFSAINHVVQLVNMPNPEVKPAAFINWAEDIVDLLAYIYNKDYDTVSTDIQEALGLLDDE